MAVDKPVHDPLYAGTQPTNSSPALTQHNVTANTSGLLSWLTPAKMFTPIYKLKQRVKRKLTLSVLKSPTSHPPLTDPECTASCSLSDSELCDKQTRSENFNSRKNLVLSENKLLPTNTSTQLPRPTPELFSDDDCNASSILNVANDLSVLRTIEAELIWMIPSLYLPYFLT